MTAPRPRSSLLPALALILAASCAKYDATEVTSNGLNIFEDQARGVACYTTNPASSRLSCVKVSPETLYVRVVAGTPQELAPRQ